MEYEFGYRLHTQTFYNLQARFVQNTWTVFVTVFSLEGQTVSSNHSEKINIYKPKGIFVKSQSLTFNLFKSAFNAQAK